MKKELILKGLLVAAVALPVFAQAQAETSELKYMVACNLSDQEGSQESVEQSARQGYTDEINVSLDSVIEVATRGEATRYMIAVMDGEIDAEGNSTGPSNIETVAYNYGLVVSSKAGSSTLYGAPLSSKVNSDGACYVLHSEMSSVRWVKRSQVTGR